MLKGWRFRYFWENDGLLVDLNTVQDLRDQVPMQLLGVIRRLLLVLTGGNGHLRCASPLKHPALVAGLNIYYFVAVGRHPRLFN